MAKAAKEPHDFLPLTPAEFHILMVLADADLPEDSPKPVALAMGM